MERFTARTLVTADALLRADARHPPGWPHLGARGVRRGISSVAAPVADGSGEVVAAVHLHGPSYRFPAPGDTDALAALVVASAARISESLRQAG